ncbi:MAG: MBL fold metallo-hydrolase [Candidatus Aenigmatarchaeota archaeon]
MRIDENILLLNGAGMDSNVYCIDNELLVDAGTGAFVEETLEQMDRFDVDPGKIKKIILTHEHLDHSGAAKQLKEKLGAKLLAHEDAKLTPEAALVEYFEDRDFEPPEVDKHLKEDDTIKTSNYQFKVLHTPGHSPGSISLWDKNNQVLVPGDLLFVDGFGRTDIPGGDEDTIKESLRRVKNLGDISVLLPGHGTPASQENIYDEGVIENILSQIQ